MTKIIKLQSVRSSIAGRPATLEDFVAVDAAFAGTHGLDLDDLQDEFGTTHLIGYAHGDTLYVCVPEESTDLAGGSQVVAWMIYRLDRISRPVGYARTADLVTKLNAAIDKRETTINSNRRQQIRAVA